MEEPRPHMGKEVSRLSPWILPQCPRVRKRAVAFHYSRKLIFNHCHLFHGRRPCESAKEILAPTQGLLVFTNPADSFRERDKQVFPLSFPHAAVARLDAFNDVKHLKNPLHFLLLGRV